MEFSKNRRIAKHCPCGKSNRDLKFAPYENSPNFGYCHSCGESFFPDTSVISKPIEFNNISNSNSFIDIDLLQASVSSAKRNPNNFLRFITAKFGTNSSALIQKRFSIGNSSRWPGSCVFWQLDDQMKVRSGKILLYDPIAGNRDKSKNDWVHSILLRKNIIPKFKLKQCLFGLHQIHGMTFKELETLTIAIVESAKSACIMSVICPNLIWMSCESLHGLQLDKFKVLKPCTIILYPDLGEVHNNPFTIWSDKSSQLNQLGYNTRVSDLLINNATEEQIRDKQDIADFF